MYSAMTAAIAAIVGVLAGCVTLHGMPPDPLPATQPETPWPNVVVAPAEVPKPPAAPVEAPEPAA
jgi:hypothetical protein